VPRREWYRLSVRHTVRGSVNWTALAAVASSLTALVALGTAVLVFRHVREDSQRILFSTALESLWRLDEQWNSDAMLDARGAAAQSLLDGRPSRDVDAVLDFFDRVALLERRGALDAEMVWYQFYWPMASYWVASHDYIHQAQQTDVTVWQELDALVPRLEAIEARHRKRAADQVLPTPAQLRDFLGDESQEDECTEDDDGTRKTPL